MSDLIKKIKIKKQDGTYTDYIPIGAEAKNIDCADGTSVEYKLNRTPYYYNCVVDMKADTKLKVGDMAITLGYYEPNDGGGAEYRIVNGEYTDNKGAYHELANQLFAELCHSDFNVKKYGAKGDNVADDSEAFTLTINDLYEKNVNGGIIIIPNGMYIIDNVNFYLNKNYSINKERDQSTYFVPEIRFVGESRANTIIKSSSYTFYPYAEHPTALQNATFENLTFDGQYEASTLIRFEQDYFAGLYIIIKNCYIMRYTEAGLKYLRAMQAELTPMGENTRITIQNCRFTYNENGIIISGDDMNIIDTNIQNNKKYGIKLVNSLHRLSLVRCKIQYNGNGTTLFNGGQILMDASGQDLLIDNCYFENKSGNVNNNDIGIIIIKPSNNKNFQHFNIQNCYCNLNGRYFIHNVINNYSYRLTHITISNNTIRNYYNTIAYLIYTSNDQLDDTNANSSNVSEYFVERGTRMEHKPTSSTQDNHFYLFNGIVWDGNGGVIKESYGQWGVNTENNLRGCVPTIIGASISNEGNINGVKMGDFTVSHPSLGVYNIIFDREIKVPGITYGYYPITVMADNSNPIVKAVITNRSTTGFTVNIGTIDLTNGNLILADLRFSFIAMFITMS